MQRSLVPIACLLVVLSTGTAHAEDPTAEAPRPARFQAWLPFLRLDRSPAPLSLTTEAHLGGAGSGVAIDGARAYQVKAGRLLVWDLADWDAATVIGQAELPWADAPGEVTVVGGVAVVLQQRRCASVSASDPPELRARDCVQAAIVDTHDGRAPTLLSTIPIDGQSALMSRWGDWLYVAATIDEDGFGADPSMLLAYDLRRPATPTLTGRLDGLPVMQQLVAGADLVAASGTKGDGSGRLLLFESRSGHPRLKGDLPVGDREVDCLFTVGDRLWLIGRNRDLLSWRWLSGTRFDEQAATTFTAETWIVDEAMELDGQLCTFDGAEESVRGGARPHNQLACFDVSDPSAPAPTTAFTVPADEPLRLPAAEDGRLLLSAPNRGAIVLVDPRRAEGDRIRMLDRGAGAIDSLLRRGAQLYSWEYQGRLRRWDLGAPIGPGTRGVDALAAEDHPIISTDLMGEGPAGRWLVRGRRVSGFPNAIQLLATEVDDPSRTVRGSDLRVNLRGCAGETYVASGDLVMIGETRCSGIPDLFQTLRVSDAGFTPASVPDLDAVSDQVLWLGSRPVVLNRDQPDRASLTVVDDDYRTVLARLGDLGAVSAAAIVGRRAYLATTVDGLRDIAQLRVVDLADPTHPTLIDGTELPLAETAYLYGSATRLLAAGWARKPGDHRGELEPALCILDIGAVTPPVVAGCAQDTPLPRTPTSWALDPDGQHLYVAGNGLTVLRVELP